MQCPNCHSEMVNTIGGNYHCPNCNMAVNDLVFRNYNPTTPTAGSYQFGTTLPFVEQGWQCPICKAVMSPRERCCINCKGNGYRDIGITWGVGGTGNPPSVNLNTSTSITNGAKGKIKAEGSTTTVKRKRGRPRKQKAMTAQELDDFWKNYTPPKDEDDGESISTKEKDNKTS